MASNPFDQFDNVASNPFDQFDEGKKSPNAWGSVEDFVKGTGGVAAGLGDLAAGAIKMPLAWGLGVGGGLKGENLNESRRIGQQAVEELFPSIGQTTGMNQTPAYKAMMAPFDWLGNKIEQAGEATGPELSGATKLTLDALLMGGSIPGAKLAKKGFVKAAETLDPQLRNAGANVKAEAAAREIQRLQEERTAKPTPKTTDENLAFYKQEALRKQEEAEVAAKARGEQPIVVDKEGNAFQTEPGGTDTSNVVNPYELGGRSALEAQQAEANAMAAPVAADLPKMPAMSPMERMRRELLGGKDPGEVPLEPATLEPYQAPLERAAFELTNPPGTARQFDAQTALENRPTSWHEPTISGLDVSTGKSPAFEIGENPKNIPAERTFESGADWREEPELNPLAAWENWNPKTRQEIISDLTNKINEELKKTTNLNYDKLDDLMHQRENHQALFDHEQTQKALEKIIHPYDMPGGTTEMGMGITPPKAVRDLFDRAMRSMENDLAAGPATTIPTNPEIRSAIEQARLEKDGKLWNLTQSGGTSAAYKTGSTLINTARLLVQNHQKQSDYLIRQHVFPAESALRKLSKQEVLELGKLFRDENTTNVKYDGDILAQRLSAKQLIVYDRMRSMFDASFEAQNAERKAKGQPEITRREAYLASKWVGDFKRPVYETIKNSKGEVVLDKDGKPAQKLVWYLADNTRRGLKKQWKALQKDNPELILGDEHAAKFTPGQTDMQSMYTKMLDILGRDDPAVERVKKMWEDYQQVEAEFTKGQQRHFENKAGIRGFVGDRPGVEPCKDTLEMLQQNIQYAKNAFQWSEMQKAADGVKQLLSDKELNQSQPNNVSYVREYFKNALGQSESKATREISEGLARATGVSPKVLQQAIGDVKGFFILQKIGVSSGFALANVIQTTNVIPYLMHMTTEGYGSAAGLLKSVSLSYPVGLMMMAAHYLKAKGGSYMESLPNQFFKDMFKYAEENGVNTRSIYDESPLSHSFGPTAAAGRGVATTISVPETFTRSTAFAAYCIMLKESGKFTDMNELFQKAEDYVNLSMVDYRTSEKPMLFPKLGTAGSLLNTLQTYPVSYYNQFAHMTKYMVDGFKAGKPQAALPLVAMLFMQYQLAGAMGAPIANDAYKLYMWAKDQLPAKEWQKLQENSLASDPKLWLMENAGNASVYGNLSEQTGLGLSAKVAAPSPSEMFQSPIGPIVDVAKQAGKWAKVAADPTNVTKIVEAARASAFPVAQGLIETNPWGEGITYNTRADGTKVYLKPTDLSKKEGQFARTPKEESIRRWGLRPQSEVKLGETLYDLAHQETVGQEKTKSVVDAYYKAAREGDVAEARELSSLYVRMTGKEINDSQMTNQVKQEFLTSLEKAQTSPAMTLQQLQNISRLQNVLEKTK